MTTRYRLGAALLVTLTCCAVFADAQQPPITNGQISVQPAGAPFGQTFKSLVSAQADVSWIGYTIASSREDGDMNCYGNFEITPKRTGTVHLEGSDRIVVMFRVADKSVDKVRMFSEDCQLDAGGKPVRWLEN